ncbi:MAG: TIR domain-containing protein [Xanthobacteraceae bacterium]
MKIFVGYPSERLSDARTIWEFLTSLGLTAWFDKESILPGEDWRAAREKAQDGSDLVIHLISSEVLKRSGEVQRELKRTLDLASEKPFGALYLIPVILDELQFPVELSRFHYVDYRRADWRYLIAKSVVRKFEQLETAIPDELSNFINAQSSAGGRIDLKIHDVTAARELQADYFRYRFGGRYFDFVNAEITSFVLSDYFLWRREKSVPEHEEHGSMWQCQVREHFRCDHIISLSFDHFTYMTGAAHGYNGVSSMNFGGEDIGRFELHDLFDRNGTALDFLLRFTELGVRQHALIEGDGREPDIFADFGGLLKDPEEGWKFLKNFTFDKDGISIRLNPYVALAFAFGTIEVRIGWERLWDQVASEFKIALGSAVGQNFSEEN